MYVFLLLPSFFLKTTCVADDDVVVVEVNVVVVVDVDVVAVVGST